MSASRGWLRRLEQPHDGSRLPGWKLAVFASPGVAMRAMYYPLFVYVPAFQVLFSANDEVPRPRAMNEKNRPAISTARADDCTDNPSLPANAESTTSRSASRQDDTTEADACVVWATSRPPKGLGQAPGRSNAAGATDCRSQSVWWLRLRV